MFTRGIQVVGLLVSMCAFVAIHFLRRKNRLNSRSFFFWVGFWSIFIVIDVYPSLTSFITPFFTLGTNMYTLTALSILILFVLVFSFYSYLSDLNWKVNQIVREQALLDWKTNNLVARLGEQLDE